MKRIVGTLKPARPVLTIQFIVTLLAVATSLIFFDAITAFSVGIGGGINIITTACFAGKVFSVGRGATAAQVSRAFYFGEVLKIALTVLLFSATFAWLDIKFLPLFLAYLATLLAYWLVLPLSIHAEKGTL